MRGTRRNLPLTLPVLVLLSWHSAVQAFSFCFSFGGHDRQRPHRYGYLPPLPGNLPGLYGGYPYRSEPVYPGYYGYSMPYGTLAVEPVPADQG